VSFPNLRERQARSSEHPFERDSRMLELLGSKARRDTLGIEQRSP